MPQLKVVPHSENNGNIIDFPIFYTISLHFPRNQINNEKSIQYHIILHNLILPWGPK